MAMVFFLALVGTLPCWAEQYPPVNKPVVQPAFTPLPLGQVKPSGWLQHQCQLAKQGLAGEGSYWRADQGWGKGQPKDWVSAEQRAYTIDGLLSLGYLLDDSYLIQRAEKDIADVLSGGHFKLVENGREEDSDRNLWPLTVYARALVTYYRKTADPRALTALEQGLTTLNWDWGRDVTLAEPMLEAYLLGGSPTLKTHALQQLAKFRDRYTGIIRGKQTGWATQHAVTYHECVKVWAIAHLFDGDQNSLAISTNAYADVAPYRLFLPHGCSSGHEILTGVDGIAVTETCNAIDLLHSLSWLYRIVGSPVYGDRMEKNFFNFAFSTVSRDFKQNVYFSAPNNTYKDGHFRMATKGGNQCPCCVSNIPRLLPSYIRHMWAATPDDGLAALLWGPCSVVAKVGVAGRPVRLQVQTDYPFEETIRLQVELDQGPVTFPLRLRIPEWCPDARLQVNDREVAIERDQRGFALLQRAWQNGDRITLLLPMKPLQKESVTFSTGVGPSSYLHGSNKPYGTGPVSQGYPFTTIEYGPLLFAAPTEDGGNYACLLPRNAPLKLTKSPMPPNWDWSLAAPLKITVTGRKDWTIAPRLYPAPQRSSQEDVAITLVPYGCTKETRFSMFPILDTTSAK